jgi:hypothetical protein
MPMQLLERLCDAQLPMAIHDDEDIAKCGVLRAAKLIESDLPPLLYEPRGVMHCGRQGMGVLHMMDAWRAPDSAVLNQGAIDSAPNAGNVRYRT